jgi:hypothetical protein
MQKVQETIHKADKDPVAAAKIEGAFGKNWKQHHAKLKETAQELTAYHEVKVETANPAVFDARKSAQKGRPVKAGAQANTGNGVVSFGSEWHESSAAQRASVFVHELSHFEGTGDHFIKKNGQFVNGVQKAQLEKAGKVGKDDIYSHGGCKFSHFYTDLLY